MAETKVVEVVLHVELLPGGPLAAVDEAAVEHQLERLSEPFGVPAQTAERSAVDDPQRKELWPAVEIEEDLASLDRRRPGLDKPCGFRAFPERGAPHHKPQGQAELAEGLSGSAGADVLRLLVEQSVFLGRVEAGDTALEPGEEAVEQRLLKPSQWLTNPWL